jgi:ABC-type multidrug transport system fused ATPase/permease subunit
VRTRSRGLAQAESGLYSKVSEALGAIRAVKAHGAEERELSTFTDRARETQKAYVRVATLSTLGGLVNELIAGLSTAAVVLVGALIALRGGITVGELLVFMAYLAALQAPITTLAQSALVVQRSRSSAERVVEILDEVEDERTLGGRRRLAKVEGALTFEAVDFRYLAPDGTSRGAALSGLDLHIRPGEMVALVGRSGAGKSTLLSLMMGFYRPQSGRIAIDGLDLKDAEIGWLRSQVALVLQEAIIFSATIAENIGYARPGAHRHEIEAAARAANLHEFILTLPDGYDTEVGERGARLSGGQKQRIGIARAFLKDAPILILDEPTSNLDAATERHVFEALHRLAEGRTTLLVAHRLATAQRADRIVVMEDGRIVEQGTHAALIACNGRYASFWADQNARSEAPATAD